MKLFSWNYQELENPWLVQDLCLLILNKSSNLVFLMETKLDSMRLEKMKRRIDYEGCITINALGSRGGLAFLQRREGMAKIFNYSH